MEEARRAELGRLEEKVNSLDGELPGMDIERLSPGKKDVIGGYSFDSDHESDSSVDPEELREKRAAIKIQGEKVMRKLVGNLNLKGGVCTWVSSAHVWCSIE